MRICVFNHPDSFNHTPIDNLLQVLISITPDIHCVFGVYEYNYYRYDKTLTCHCIPHTAYSNAILRIFKLFTHANSISKENVQTEMWGRHKHIFYRRRYSAITDSILKVVK